MLGNAHPRCSRHLVLQWRHYKNYGTISSTNIDNKDALPETAYVTGLALMILKGGSWTSTGGGAFDTDNKISGYGTFSADLTNRGTLSTGCTPATR